MAFWVDYANPTLGTFVPTVDGSSISTTEVSSSTQAVVFSSGQASVQVRYKDLGQIQLELKDADIRGASSAFVVQPADFVVTLIEDSSGTANPGANTMAGSGFVAAGESFTVEVEVRDRQGSITPNYGSETSLEGLTIISGNLVAPVSGFHGSSNAGVMDNALLFSAKSPAGTFENTSVSWDETGIIQLSVSVADGDYLGSGNVIGTLSNQVGRFTPAGFVLVSSSVSGSCNNRTYMGEPGLGVSYQVEARSTGGSVLRKIICAACKIKRGIYPFVCRRERKFRCQFE